MAHDHGVGREVRYVAHTCVTNSLWFSPGDVVGVTAMGQHIIYLNSVETAQDLLEKRSGLYSDRPHSSMLEL